MRAANAGTPSRRLLVLLTALVGAFALALLGSDAAAAAPYPPGPGVSPYSSSDGCRVSTTTVHAGPGSTVTFVGSGFGPHQSVSLSIPSASAALGGVTTTGSGTFRGSFTWPASVDGKSAVVQASAPSTTCSFVMTNSKFANSVVTNRGAGDGSNGSALSPTGFATLTVTTAAIVLLGLGGLVLGLSRRRRV